MSDYVKKKVIRYPIDAEVAIAYKCDDFWDLEDKFKEIDKDFGNWKLKPRFELDSSYNSKQGKSRYYLDYILNYEYGACDGDFGISQELTEKLKDKYKPIFEKFIEDIDVNKFRLVKFCYYNGCDCPDYYETTPPMTDDEEW